MKKNRKVSLQLKRIVIISMVVVGIFKLGSNQLKEDLQTIKAADSSVSDGVTLAEGTADEYKVPKDATTLNDPSLKTRPAFNQYVSENKYVINFAKINNVPITAISTPVHSMSIGGLQLDSTDRALFTVSFNDWTAGKPYQTGDLQVTYRAKKMELEASRWVDGVKLPLTQIPMGGTSVLNGNLGAFSQAAGFDNRVTSIKDSPAATALYTHAFGLNTITENKQVIAKVDSIIGPGQNYSTSTLRWPNIGYNKNIYAGPVVAWGNLYTTRGVRMVVYSPTGVASLREMKLRDIYDPQIGAVPTPGEKLRIGVMNWTNIGEDSVGKTLATVYYEDENRGGFSKVIYIWNKDGSISQEMIFNKNTTVTVIEGISDKETIYFRKAEANKVVKILKYTAATATFEEYPIEYPKGSTFIINKDERNPNQYIAYGNTPTFTEAFQDFSGSTPSNGGVFIANLDKDFNVINVAGIHSAVPMQINQVKYLPSDPSKIFMTGIISLQDKTGSFVNKIASIPGNTAINGQWQTKWAGGGDVWFGTLQLEDDYAPALLKGGELALDITQSEIKNQDDAIESPVLNNLLIHGNKTGTKDPKASIQVYDYFDLERSLSAGFDQEWLDKRINRNPLNLTKPIEWTKLGFDKTKTGPQLLKYFVTDSQNTTSAISRWINKKTPETVIDQDAALDAQNFDIPLTEVQAGALDTSRKIRTKAKTMAWNTTTHKIDENAEAGVFDDTKITFTNPAQVTALQQATEAKPYPVDIQYKGAKTVVNRVWVFVTDEQTTIDKENDVVIYAQDYRLALHVAKNETKPKVYQNSAIKVYQYTDISHETVSPLEPIADKDNATQLDVKDADLTKITKATNPSVIDTELSFTNPNKGNQVTKATIKVTLFHGLQDIRVKFEDENGKPLPSDVVLTGLPVGSTVDLATNQAVKDGIKVVLDTKNYTLKTRPVNETATVVGPTGTTATYIFKGNVRFISITPELTFETGFILPIQQKLQYKNTTTDFNVVVRDNRQYKGILDDNTTGYRGDFRIDAQLTKPFTHNDYDRPLLGAQLQYNHTDITAAGEPVSQSHQDPAAKEKVDFTIKLDEKGGSDDGWKLIVPAGSAEKGKYTAEITWTLVEGP